MIWTTPTKMINLLVINLLVFVVILASPQGSSAGPKAKRPNPNPEIRLTSESGLVTPENTSKRPKTKSNLDLSTISLSTLRLDDLINASVPNTIQLARHYFAQFPRIERQAELRFEVQPSTASRRIIELSLREYDHLILGEHHHADYAPKKILIENMDLLKEHVAILALEHITEDQQRYWDDYFNDSSGRPMNNQLQDLLEALDEGHFKFRERTLLDENRNHRYGFFALAVAAKTHGVPVIFFETEGSKLAGYSLSGSQPGFNRRGAMNFVDKIFVDEKSNGRKVVHFVGAGHIGNRNGAIGLSELHRNAIAVVVSEVPDQTHPCENKLHVNEGEEGVIADIQLSCTLPFEASL